jgi:ribonuclease Z
MHMHVDDIAEWLRVAECEAMVLTHISRRTHLGLARDRLAEVAGSRHARRALILMDHKTNKERYEQQLGDAELGSRPPRRGR